MSKQSIYQKNSFILFEVILSVIILSIAVYSFTKISITSTNYIYYNELQNHTKFKSISTFGYTFDGLENATVTIDSFGSFSKYEYHNEHFKLVQYSLDEK